jgi:hypothetical protein
VGCDGKKPVVFTKYTYSGSLGTNMHIYARKGYPNYHYGDKLTKKQKNENRAIKKASKHWVAGEWAKRGLIKDHTNGTYFCLSGWYRLDENFPSFRHITRKINGKKVNILVFTNVYTWANYYPTKALAKRYRVSNVKADIRFK